MKLFLGNPILIFFLLTLQFAYSQSWGSLYIDKNSGIAGGAYDSPNSGEASRAAEQSCINKHKKQGLPHKCILAGSFFNACNAVFWSSDNKKVGWASAFYQSDAENLARNTCIKTGARNCTLRMSFCTTRFM